MTRTKLSGILIQTTRPRNSQLKKGTCRIEDFAVPANHRVRQKENEKRVKYQDFARELKKLWNMKVTMKIILIGLLGMVTKGFITRTGGLGNKRTREEHPNYSIIEFCQNTEKGPGD